MENQPGNLLIRARLKLTYMKLCVFISGCSSAVCIYLAGVFMKDVWIYNFLPEESADSGSSHPGKGCNY